MTRRLVALVSLLASLAALPALAAQEGPPGPAAELARFDSLLGHWEGTGTAVMIPGTPPAKWTSTSTYQKALGGHVVQEDTVVTFEGMEQPMAFRAYLGWDRENQAYYAIGIGNTGEASKGEVTFLPDGTQLQLNTQVREGTPFAERVRLKVDGDSMSFAMEMLMPEGSSQEFVTGSMKRVAKGKPLAVEATAAMAPPSSEIGRCNRMAGTYAVTGSMVMMPGMAPMKITGTDVVRPIFGNTVLQVVTTGHAEGSPEAYEAHGYFCWNPARKRYQLLSVDNMGQVGNMDGWFGADGKTFVCVGAQLYMGTPSAQRFVMHLDGEGRLLRGVGHNLVGDAAPFECFTCEYKRQ